MAIEISAIPSVPDFARGYVKDLRIRWALREAGVDFSIVFADQQTRQGAAYRQWQPFGQVPAYRDNDVELFESGAILLHLARTHTCLGPKDPKSFGRVESWVFSALSSLEPYVQYLIHFDGEAGGPPAEKARTKLNDRLAALADALGDSDFLEGTFTVADLMMCSVLRELVETEFLIRYPTLDAYRQRCEARPAFQAALAEQLADYDANAS